MEYMHKVGDIPTFDAIEVMKEYEIDLSNHKATNIKDAPIEKMDLILCATNSHKVAVKNLYPELADKIYTMKEYASLAKEGLGYDISDPWGYGMPTYQKCAIEIEKCLEKIVEKL